MERKYKGGAGSLGQKRRYQSTMGSLIALERSSTLQKYHPRLKKLREWLKSEYSYIGYPPRK